MKQETKVRYQSFGIKGITKRFKQACFSGDLEIIQYLLTSPDLKECVNIHTNGDFAFRTACKRGFVDVVKYLSTSSELKEHADIKIMNNIGLRQARENGHLDIANFLLYFKLDEQILLNKEMSKFKI